MAISLSVTPTGLSGLAEVSPVVFALLTEETSTSSTSVSAVLDSAPDAVVLSDAGQLLSAISTFQNDLGNLGTLQAGAADTSPLAALPAAQNLVDTFNRLQGSVGSLPTVVEPLVVNSSVTLLNELETTAAASSLPSIGIALQTVSASSATATSSVLRIDLGAFNAALATAPDGTQAVLSNAVQALIDLAAGFEAQLAEASATAASLTQAGATLVTATVTPTPTTAAPAAAVAVVTPDLTEAALPATIAAPVPSQLPATTPALTNAEQIDSNGSASAATLALQRLLDDPALRARKNLLDPAYASLTAAFHVSDFALPGQTIDPNAGLPDFPPQIQAVAPADGIAYYKEAAEDPRSRVVKRINQLI